jgi:cytochrome P450
MNTPRLPPGPRERFLTGSLFEFKRNPLALLERYAREYGDLARFRILTRQVYLVSHPSYVEQILGIQQHSFVKRSSPHDVGGVFGNGMLTSNGNEWRRQRRTVSPAFHKQHFRDYADIIVSEIEHWIADWRDGDIRDLHREMAGLSLVIVARTLFGAMLHDDAEALNAAMDILVDRFWLECPVGLTLSGLLPTLFPTRANLRLRKSIREIDRVAYTMIGTPPFGSQPGGSLLRMLLNACDADGKPIAQRQLRDELVTVLLAGHETTACALTWSWYLLAANPEAERKLAVEALTEINGDVSHSDVTERLCYTRAVVLESMRVYPPVWGINRVAVRDCEIGGHLFPRGTSVIMSQWVIHHDPRFYDQPSVFLPERWTPEFVAGLPRYAYFPFGGGQRSCIGSELAMLELVLTLAVIARRFKIELVGHEPLRPAPSITLRPSGDLRIILHARKNGGNNRCA